MFAALTLVGALLVSPVVAATGPPPTAPCPDRVPAGTRCFHGQAANGAFYSVAIPANWNGSLVLHAHGGPDLGAPEQERTIDDLNRWAVMVREGYAWAGSSYRRGGYGTQMAVQDTEALRRWFVGTFGQPRLTILHGQSWGGNVAAKAAETYRYDGVLLTNGVLGGGSRGYNARVDLRVIYQYYCHNHPRPEEPQYPLWMGLRAGSTMTSTGLRARLQECTGIESPAAERTPLQQRNLTDLLAVTRLPERTLASHLNFATFTFRDIVHQRLGGRNPFSNQGVWYRGSHDDVALNLGVQRFGADPVAKRNLSYDSDLTGEISFPVLTMHAIDDPTAVVEHESAYRSSVAAAGNARWLQQVFTEEHEHSALSDAEYATALDVLVTWVRNGRKPSAQSIAKSCPAADTTYGTGCFFNPSYTPARYESRIFARPGERRWPAMTAKQAQAWSKIPGIGIP